MLSATSEYALRAALVMARQYGQRPLRADEIADAIGAPRNYMAKTLNALAKAGVATSARGPFGGFQLALSPDQLTVAEVIDCFEEPPKHQRCLLGDTHCDPRIPCAAHFRWTAISMARREPFATTTLADLVGDPGMLVTSTHPKVSNHVVPAY